MSHTLHRKVRDPDVIERMRRQQQSSAPLCLRCGTLTNRAGIDERTCPECRRRYMVSVRRQFVAGRVAMGDQRCEWTLKEVTT